MGDFTDFAEKYCKLLAKVSSKRTLGKYHSTKMNLDVNPTRAWNYPECTTNHWQLMAVSLWGLGCAWEKQIDLHQTTVRSSFASIHRPGTSAQTSNGVLMWWQYLLATGLWRILLALDKSCNVHLHICKGNFALPKKLIVKFFDREIRPKLSFRLFL